MSDNSTIEKMRAWMHENSGTVGTIVSVAIFTFGVLLVIGAIKNWDWLFKPAAAYHNKWTIGQASRYLGRNTARVIGFAGGILLIVAGGIWSYMTLFRK